jgi:hypothetical protein
MGIEIEYDGAYPTLCMGTLVVVLGGKRWNFGQFVLSSGGSVSFDANWSETVTSGPWDVREWPAKFPEKHKAAVLREINERIPHGCCGGCV